MMAIIDLLAGKLSDLTGSEFEVKRVKIKVPYTENEVLRYGIGVMRDGEGMLVPLGGKPLTQNEARTLLVGMCNLIEYGFVRIEKVEEKL